MQTIKPFLTYAQQINHLINDKGLIINDVDEAKKALEEISYYVLIGGYKNEFYNPMTRTYIPGTTFDDILILYYFDDNLRELVLKYSRVIERKIRSLISYYFCSTYSNLQQDYLDCKHYVNTRRAKADIKKLINKLDWNAKKDNNHQYIVYQRKKYGNVPLWALMNTLTFGETSKMYSFIS